MTKITRSIKNEVKKMLESSVQYSIISQKLNISKGSITNIKKELGIKLEKKIGGRPRKLSLRTEKSIIRDFSTKDGMNTTKMVKKIYETQEKKVSKKTICRILHKNGYKSYKNIRKPLLSNINVQKRFTFAKKFIKSTYQNFKNIIFTDEKKFNLEGSDGNEKIWVKGGYKSETRSYNEISKFKGGSIMIWGAITYKGVGAIIRTNKRINSGEYIRVLGTGLFETLDMNEINAEECIFMQDNAPAHKSSMTINWFKTQNIRLLDWPPSSPDLNLIENVWGYLEKQIRTHKKVFNNADELFDIIKEEWKKIPSDYIKTLYRSIMNRIKQLYKRKGRHTTY